jgi:two-component sensor histidine kinase
MFSTLIGSALERAFVYQQLHETLDEKEVLLQELQHRTRNNMNVIISLLNMQAGEQKNEQLKKEFKIIENRIYAMSTAYNKLQDGPSLHYIDLRAYLIALAGSLYHSSGLPAKRVKLHLDCEDVSVHLEQAVPVGLIFNEIMSNAVTHAFPGEQAGSIWITLKRSDNQQIHLSIKDDGIGMPEDATEEAKKSMGFRIIEMLARDQLGGSHSMSSSNGVEHFLTF